ncbi:unnamed protein product [Pedinophyceae sp. YPF-701]|nr:unnamed protein product [Pedinophyceae sp. YPF-701]
MAPAPQGSGLRRFLDPYYVGNVVLCAGYLLVRTWVLNYSDLTWSRVLVDKSELLQWERTAFGTLGAALFIKFVRRQSFDGFLASAFLYSKAVLALMVWVCDVRLFIYYMVFYWIHSLLTTQPLYQGPANITYLDGQQMGLEITGPKADKSVRWLVEFYATWHPVCVALEPIFASLSVQYGCECLRFAKVDVGRYPGLARDFGVDVSGQSKQLPTLVFFEHGKEVARIPHVFSDGSVNRGLFRKKDIVKGFALEDYYKKLRWRRPKGKEKADGAPVRTPNGDAAQKDAAAKKAE